MERVRTFYNDESGATMAEYCIFLGFIAVIIVSAIATFGLSVKSLFTKANTDLP
jgi:Flp pilus assembly pilin Flp